MTISTFCVVGVTRFELATPRPPDAYSNRTELHPERTCRNAKVIPIYILTKFFDDFFSLKYTANTIIT